MFELIFILLVPLAVLSWFRPQAGVLCVLALLPTYVVRGVIGSIPTTFLELSIYIVGVVWLIRVRPKLNIKNVISNYRTWMLPILSGLAACLIGVVVADDTRVALGIMKGWIVDPIIATLLILSAGELTKDKFIFWQECIFMLLLGASVTSIAAIVQFINMDYIGRAHAWYDSPNVMTMYLVPIAVAAFGWVVVEANGRISRSWIWVWGCLILLTVIGIATSGSISGILALSVGVMIYITFSVIKVSTFWLKIVGTSIILAGLLIPWFSVNQGNFPLPTRNNETSGAASGEIRVIMWREAIKVIRQHPFQGLGLGQWQGHFAPLIKPGMLGVLNPGYLVELHFASLFPHNLWLTAWLFTGVIGLVSLVGISSLVFYNSKSSILPAAVLSAILVIGIVDTPIFKNDLAIIFGLVIAAAVSAKSLLLYDRTQPTV